MPEADKSIGQKILSFFIKDEESTGTAVGTPPVGQPAPPRPGTTSGSGQPAPVPPAPSATPSASPGVGVGTIDAKFAGHFADVLAQNNPPGPDYFEFREALRSLDGLNLPEDKQFQAAWASFKALGGPADVKVLTNTANQYVTALTKDREAFGKSVDAALAERVGGLQNEQQRLKTENESLANQLLEIQKRIDANNNRLATIDTDMAEQSGKITQNRQNYDVTYAHFVDQIKSDIAKMTQFLK